MSMSVPPEEQTMTWTALKSRPTRSRGEILRDVSAAADQRADGALPLDVDGVADAFRDELDLLGALQLRWHTRLAGRIDRELMNQPMDLEAAVVAAWHATADELPGIRAVVDRHREQPLDDAMARALETATRKERTWLAVMAGQSGLADPRAHVVGEAIEQKARATHRPRPVSHRDESRTLVGRLKAALAA
jgi:hypothetical protein